MSPKDISDRVRIINNCMSINILIIKQLFPKCCIYDIGPLYGLVFMTCIINMPKSSHIVKSSFFSMLLEFF